MKMLFKQKLFSWFDSYDIYDEHGETLYTVKGQFGFGHRFKVLDNNEREVGYVKQRIWTWLPKFDIYVNEELIGTIKKEFTFLRHKFTIDYKGWVVEGDFLGWDYRVKDASGNEVARVSKQIFKLTDTYEIDVVDSSNALNVLLLVIAIDAEECSRNNN